MTDPQIRPATTADATRIAELIGAAFHSLHAAIWLIPDPEDRARVLPANFTIYVDHALTHGQIHLVVDDSATLTAAAVWFPQLTGPTPVPDDYDTRLQAACGPHTDRFRTLDKEFDNHHPHAYPHHHLAFLATRPDQQGRGLGTALLHHHHRHLDQHRMPAFLQASSKRSRALYERAGYQCLGEPFHLPDGPPFWNMWREPTRPGVSTAEQW
jgi:GNAT superfamily N-acetyltransferase